MLRTLIVDDELAAIRVLLRLLSAHPSIAVIGAATDAAEARRLIQVTKPDVAFLDIELGVETGFDLIEGQDRPRHLVFVTAHPVHAVEAFSVEADDFLVKPIDPARLAETVRRLERRHSAPDTPAPILLRLPGRTLLVPPDDILSFNAEGDFARVRLTDGTSLLIHGTLGHFESVVPSPPFLRLDRSLILNTTRVRRLLMKDRNGWLVTLDGQEDQLVLGRAAASRLRAALTTTG